MSIAPHDMVVNELVGLEAHVVESTDPGQVSRTGIIRSEARNVLGIESKSGIIMIPKSTCVFEITLPDKTKVRVDGRLLQGRPEDRMKKRLNRSW